MRFLDKTKIMYVILDPSATLEVLIPTVFGNRPNTNRKKKSKSESVHKEYLIYVLSFFSYKHQLEDYSLISVQSQQAAGNNTRSVCVLRTLATPSL